MSTTITSMYGERLRIESARPGEVDLKAPDATGRIYKTSELLAAMKAEGVLDAVEIITELPKVEESPGGKNVYVRGVSFNVDGGGGYAADYRQRALSQLAVARHLEAKEELEAIKLRSAEALLNTRRNEVAGKLGAHPNYDVLTEFAKRSIDLVIALEDQLAAK